jgi:hypothetical protein
VSAAQAAELAGSAGDRGRCQAPELEQVVSGRDELPFGRAGRQAAALEAVDTPQDLGVGKDGLDDLLSAAIERLAQSSTVEWAVGGAARSSRRPHTQRRSQTLHGSHVSLAINNPACWSWAGSHVKASPPITGTTTSRRRMP